jgi:hypothetical protein
MKSFRQFLNEAKSRFTTYIVDKNKKAVFSEFLNNDELDVWVQKQIEPWLVVVTNANKWVSYKMGTDNKFKVDKKGTEFTSDWKYNKAS